MRTADGPRFACAAAALISLFVAVRLLAVSCMWTRYPEPGECVFGVVGREFSRGPVLPVFEYLHLATESQGAILPLGGLIALAFTFIGPSLSALKLVAVAVALAGIVVWYTLVRRVFGRGTALWYCAAAVLVPPALLYWSLWIDGNWLLCDLVHGAALLFLVSLSGEKRRVGRGAWPLAAFGALLGLGVFLSNYQLLIVLYSLAVLAIFRVPNSLRKAGAFAAGTLAGAVPLLWYSRHYGNQWSGMRIGPPGSKAHFVAAHSIGEWAAETLAGSASRFVCMLRFWWPESWAGRFVPPGHLGGAMAGAYEGCILAGVCLACIALSRAARALPVPPYPEASRRGGRIVFGFFAFIVAMTCLSRIAIPRTDYYPYRYLLPMAPFYLLSIAVCGDRLTLSRSRLLRAAGWSAPAVLAALLIACLVPALRGGNPAALFTTRGYDYGYLGFWIATSPLGRPVSRGLAIARRVKDPQDREDFLNYIADVQWYGAFTDRGASALAPQDLQGLVPRLRREAQPGDLPVLFRSLGRGIAWTHGSDWPAVASLIVIGETPAAFAVRPPWLLTAEEARWAWQGAGSVEAWRRGSRSDWLPPLLKDIPKGARAPFCEGAGAVWGFGARESGCDFPSLLGALSPQVRNDCLAGADLGFYRTPFALLDW
jgi:4-amino-4-deoxy-L-arabinose transferase-like glycosyltransferase